MIAAGERLDFTGFGIDALQIGAAFFGGIDENAAAIRAPIRLRRTGAARRCLIAAHAAANIVVISGGQTSGNPARFGGRDEQIRLAVGALREAAPGIDGAGEVRCGCDPG